MNPWWAAGRFVNRDCQPPVKFGRVWQSGPESPIYDQGRRSLHADCRAELPIAKNHAERLMVIQAPFKTAKIQRPDLR